MTALILPKRLTGYAGEVLVRPEYSQQLEAFFVGANYRQSGLVVNGTVSPATNNMGAGLLFTGSTDSVKKTVSTRTTTTPFTLLQNFYVVDDIAANSLGLFQISPTASGYSGLLVSSVADSTKTLRVYIGADRILSAGILTKGAYIRLGLTFNGTTTTLVINGSTVGSPYTGAMGDSSNTVWFGNGYANSLKAIHNLGMFWNNRYLSVEELKRLTKNPDSYQELFSPRRHVLYFGAGSGTGDIPSAADAGTLTLTGSAANGVRALAGVAASGSITLTESAANAVRALAGVSASGSIALTGSNAAALRAWLGIAATGSITITGSSAAGVRTLSAAASAGSITLTGSAASGVKVGSVTSAADSGSLTLTGSAASGIKNIAGIADTGSIVLTGSAAVGIKAWLAAAGAGALSLTGYAATAIYSGGTVHRVLLRTGQVATNKPDASTAYDFNGAAVSLLAFSFASRGMSTGNTLSYYADDSEGNWERGIGTWDATAKTITRTTVRDSSTGSAIDWSASTTAPTVWSDGYQPEDSIAIGAAEAYYLGDRYSEGSWRVSRSGNDLEFQRLESGAWVKKGEVQA